MIGITRMSKEVFHHSGQIVHIFITVNQIHEIQDVISSETFDSSLIVGFQKAVLNFDSILAGFNTRLILLSLEM